MTCEARAASTHTAYGKMRTYDKENEGGDSLVADLREEPKQEGLISARCCHPKCAGKAKNITPSKQRGA